MVERVHVNALTQFMIREACLREHEAKGALRRILGIKHGKPALFASPPAVSSHGVGTQS